jgi:8-oxo-dGTP pyrophosphatase MutT (NUDIX family)
VPIRVLAQAGRDRVVADFVLAHGADPVRELAVLGWSAQRLEAADLGVEGVLELRYAVEPATPVAPAPRQVSTDPGLVRAQDEQVAPYQRTAAYGVVTSDAGLLLTELSETTSAPGRWTLPGGGLDPGEQPEQALHREIWEESGQRVEQVRLLEVQTSHWIGRAPGGRLEDFHAVRIVYAAWCAAPTEPVVHDVGGSTASVRWVPFDQVESYALGRSFAPHLSRWLNLS